MRYMLLIYTDESLYGRMSEAEMQADMAAWGEYTGAIMGAGASSLGDALQPTTTATTVTLEGGDALVSDGPFAETKEQLGGFYLLDVENLDAAIEWAKKCPGAAYGKIELRPIQEYDQG
jgi:hypothetical protein